ncbi:MAG TPA: DUF72 domain-containing protein [Candidatus Limnocylindria bacterium]|nr:DUF72 domain-containing protein [Candidatus Limnocylindria bacterium]
MTGRAFVGTSGWAYASWKQKFYPPDVKAKDLLRHYATRLATNEVNYTFNHLPTQRNIDSWKEQTPADFVFALKASQYITHIKKLEEPTTTLPPFFDAVRPLGERLGPILFQTPPWLKRNDELLSMFVVALPDGFRCALEVRDPSWYADEVYAMLAARNVALVHAEGERAPSPLDTLDRTADFAYVRLRAREGYDDAAVATWAARLRATREAGKDVYAYFRHDEDGSNGLAAEALRDALA